MYDAILISPHYNYGHEGTTIPPQDTENYQDLSMIIPLGILYIAQYLNDCGYNVRVVHIPNDIYLLSRFGLTDDPGEKNVEKILAKYPARVCGIQVHWYLYCGGAVFISKLYKKLFPDSKIFLGGFMATACWKEFLSVSKQIDGVILGEGEKTFQKIVEKYLTAKNDRLDDIIGLAYRNGSDGLVYNPPGSESLLQLDEIPIIRPDAPPFGNLFWQSRQFINISRGLCPEKCSYCVGNNNRINPRAYQILKIDKILEQLHVYQEYGFHEIFLGENHFLNISFMKELIENIIRENLTFYFELETHPLIFENRKLLVKMIEAKFLRYTMGCESGSDSVLKRMGRNSNSRQILDSVKRIAQRGGIVLTSWISNLPGETNSEFKETQEVFKNVVKAGGFVYWVENLHVLPGTKLYAQPEIYRIEILKNNLEDWIEWSVFSKEYVNFDAVFAKPLKYLTHVNKNVSPHEMIERFYSNRKLARSLVPEMKLNLKDKLNNLPINIIETELKTLEWYEREGWKLWLF
jgi:radical SAM superfamily enzyme YgiQ (UPF0313 family)